jgi:hypothetical protein
VKKKKEVRDYSYWLRRGIPAVLIPGIIFASMYGVKSLSSMGKYYEDERIFPRSGEVVQVEDGDTFLLTSGQRVRMIGINAPDRGKEGYEEAKKYLRDRIENQKVWLEYDRYQNDKYGRILAWVWKGCESEKPEFLGADYMHLKVNRSRGYVETKPAGCKKGELVNKTMAEEGKAEGVVYWSRGRLKYRVQ